ncbi:unnamed protein product, partial [Rotaria sordida]
MVGYDQSNKFDNDIPIVILLLGGNLTTLSALCGYLKRDTPIVVVKGTGGLADFIAGIPECSGTMWNKVDHARENVFADHVFKNMTSSQTRQEFIKRVARTALFESLCRNNTDFVYLLMENGVSIKDLNIEQLTPEELKMFCARILNNDALPLDETKLPSIGINMKSSEFVEAIYLVYYKQYVEDYITAQEKRDNHGLIISLSDRKCNESCESNVEKECAEMYWKSKVFNKGIQISTDLALRRLELKINKGNDRQVETQNKIQEAQYEMHHRFRQLFVSQGLPTLQRIIPNIPVGARWEQNGTTVAGGCKEGSATNQLNNPRGLFVDDDQMVVIADG